MRLLDNGQLPSGKNEVDLLNFVIDKMWDRKKAAVTKPIDINTFDTSSSTTTDANNEETDIQTKGSSTCSPSWVFKGYVVFCLYLCPILTDPKQHLVHFTTDVELEGENNSRQSAKKQKKMEKQS